MKKIIIIIISATLILSAFSGCSFGGVKQVNDSLTIYLNQALYYDFNASIIKFQNNHPELEITVKKLYASETERDDNVLDKEAKSFSQQISTELMSGKGPDIILFDNYIFKRQDIYKMMKSGVFEDLMPLIKKDEGFPAQQLNMPLIESVKQDGKQYIMPLTYNVNCLLSTKATLEETNVDVSDNKSFKDILKDMNGYIDANGDINSRRKVIRQTKSLARYPLFLQDEILDYETGKADIVESIAFKEVSELYKGIYQDEMLKTGYQEESRSAVTAELEDENIVFSSIRHTGSSILPVWQGQIKKLKDSSAVIPIYNVNGETNGTIKTACAINSNSQNKQAAYELVKFLLEEEQQESLMQISVPVNKVSFKNMIPQYVKFFYYNEVIELPGGGFLGKITSSTGKTEEYKEYSSDELTQEELDEYYNLTQSVTKGYFPTPQTDSEIWNDMEPYFKGEKSYEECAQALQDRLDIYMSE